MGSRKEHVHRSHIKWLHAKGEEEAVRWFKNQWKGKSWMLLCKPDTEALQLLMPAEYRTLSVPTHTRKRGRPTASAASTLGDRKALDLASDEEERIELKVSSP
jgi:hypothetical protein